MPPVPRGLGCDFSGTFLDVYEAQIEWYLENFVIPDDYQKKILEAHRKLGAAYDDIDEQRARLKANLERLKKQHRWGHISDKEYLAEYEGTERQLRQLSPPEDKQQELQRFAHFLTNVADAWRQANQEQRNKLARTLFDQIRLDSSGRVIAVKPRAELEPFFRISYECHAGNIAGDPDGGRVHIFNIWELGFFLLSPCLLLEQDTSSSRQFGQNLLSDIKLRAYGS